MTRDGGSLRLELVREGPCRGLLTLDSVQRRLSWQGASSETGCRDAFESSFDDVQSVRLRSRPGFLVEFKKGKGRRMILIPVPHATWLENRDAAGEDLPPEVVADTRKAVDEVREVLGRSALPGAILREALYGTPTDTTVAELLESPVSYLGKAVRLRGRLEAVPEDRTRYRLQEGGQVLAVLAEAELGPFIQSQLPSWKEREVELVGRFRGSQETVPGGSEYLVSIWECVVEGEPAPAEGRRTTLAALLATPAAFVGEAVRVVGKFRGRNLFGDLPDQSIHERGGWVIKDDRYAIWVIGKPSGAGFSLDPGRRRIRAPGSKSRARPS